MTERKKSILHRFWRTFKHIVYPRVCLACKQRLPESLTDDILCVECRKKIKKNIPPFCSSCGRHLVIVHSGEKICAECFKKNLHFDRAFSPCRYDGPVKELIHEFKYKNKEYLGGPLSQLMIDFIKHYAVPIENIDYIIPMPLHPVKLREREFNQAGILGDHIAREFNKSIGHRVLLKQKWTKTQTELSHEERMHNVKNSFRVSDGNVIKGKNILLIDDVLTTGATASEAAFTLKQYGAAAVFILAIAS